MSKTILGMNARNYLYLRRYNTRRAKLRADNKLATKRRLVAADIPTTKLIQVFRNPQSIRAFDWSSLPESFVLKPARGYGGEGILVVSNWNGHVGTDSHDEPVSILDLESTIFDILDGAHSFSSLPDVAYLEEKVEVASTFRKLGLGVPDVRVIVCNRVPVMAMLRVATHQSRGRANLHMGAVGIGVDMRTGITTKGILKSKESVLIPGTKIKAHGIKIPNWDDVLEISARTQEVSGLGFAGIDIVHDERYGPLVLEVNARPGLTIQLANGESLRTRLERVDALNVPSIQKGISLAKELFAAPLLMNVPVDSNILNLVEKVTIIGTNGKRKTIEAKIDTGAFRSSIDSELVEELGLPMHDRSIKVRSGSGRQERGLVDVTFKLRGKTIKSVSSFIDRGHMNYPAIIGRLDLGGFLVNPTDQPYVK